MDLRHVWYFSAILDAGSFVAAAPRLRVAQPALSRQIRSLERELGVQLFARDRTGVRPTAAGVAFSEGVGRLTNRLEKAMGAVRQAHAGRLGTCRIGVGHLSLFAATFWSVMAEVRLQLPDVRLDIREMFGLEQIRSLRAGEIDITIIATPPSRGSGMEFEPLYEDPFEYAILSATHSLAGCEAVDPEQLRADDLLLLDPSLIPHIVQPLAEAFKRLGFERQQYHRTMTSLYTMVAAGRGWTPGTRTRQDRAMPGTASVRLRGLRHPLTIGVAWRSGEPAPVVKNMIDALRNARSAITADISSKQLSPEVPAPDRSIPATLEFRHLRAFVMAAESGSLSRAAQQLGLTQSAVSRQIQDLERITGGPLFKRAARGVEVTGAGEIFQREAADVLAVAQEVIELTRDSARGVRGRCVFGVVPTAMAPALAPALLQELSTRLPAADFVVEEMASVHQARALVDGAIDIGIAQGFSWLTDTPGIVSMPMEDDTLECALVASTHRLASLSSVTTADLAGEPFLFVARSFHPVLYDTVMESFSSLGFHPRFGGTYDGLRTLWALAATGAGWTLGSRNQVAAPPDGLVALKITGFEIPWGLEFLWRRDEPDEFLRAVIEVLRTSRTRDGVP